MKAHARAPLLTAAPLLSMAGTVPQTPSTALLVLEICKIVPKAHPFRC